MKFNRIELSPGEPETFEHDSQKVTILNLGENDLTISLEGPASSDGLIIPPGMGRTFSFGYIVRSVSVFSEKGTTVQIDGMG